MNRRRLVALSVILAALPGLAMAEPVPRAAYIGRALVSFAQMNAQGRAAAGAEWVHPAPGHVEAGYVLCAAPGGSLLVVWPADSEGQAPEGIAAGMKAAASPQMRVTTPDALPGCALPADLAPGLPVLVTPAQ